MQTKAVLSVILSLILAGIAVVSTAFAGQTGISHAKQPPALAQLKLSAFASSCKQDKEIPAEQLAAIDNQALLFWQTALGPDPVHAYSMLTPGAQHVTSEKQFEYDMRVATDPFAPFANMGVSHTYLARVVGHPQGNRVVCGTLSNPEKWVSFRVEPSTKQAWVLIRGRARNNTWMFTTWLVPVGGGWKVNSLNAGISTLASLSATELWKDAQKEESRHHLFNAFVLYNTALQFARRGSLFELGIAPAIQKELAEMQLPSLFRGRPPFVWSFGTHTFKVLNVGPIAVAGKIYLDIAYEVQPWKNYKQVDHENRELIRDFASKYPEYSAVFAGIIGEAHEIGSNQGFRTVEVLHNGSLVPVQ